MRDTHGTEARVCAAALRISGLHWQRTTPAWGIRSLGLTDLPVAGPLGKDHEKRLIQDD
jgi:hypothetical protein